MDTLESRLATFNAVSASSRAQASSSRKASSAQATAWPPSGSSKKLPSAREMALCGFTFTPTAAKPDCCTHVMCGTEIAGWKAGEDVLARLADEAPDCSLTKILLSQAEAKTKAKQGSTQWDSEALLPNGKAMAAARRETFGSAWPCDAKKGWKPTSARVANAGFYYAPLEDAKDNATCAYCERSLAGWEKSDDPVEEHRRRVPDCAFFTAEYVPVVVIDDSVQEVVVPEPAPTTKKTRAVSKRVVTGRGKKAAAAAVAVAQESDVETEAEQKPDSSVEIVEPEPKVTRKGKATRTAASRAVSEAEEEAPAAAAPTKRGTHSRTNSRALSRAATRGAKAATPVHIVSSDTEPEKQQEPEPEAPVEESESEPEPVPVKRSTARAAKATAAPKARAVSKRTARGRAAAAALADSTEDEDELAQTEPAAQEEHEEGFNNKNGTMIRHATASESEAEMDELEPDEPQLEQQEEMEVEVEEAKQPSSEANSTSSASRTAAAFAKVTLNGNGSSSSNHPSSSSGASSKRNASKSSTKAKLAAAAPDPEPEEVVEELGASTESEPIRRNGRAVSRTKPTSEAEPAPSRPASRRGAAAAAAAPAEPSSDDVPKKRTRQASASSKRGAVAAAASSDPIDAAAEYRNNDEDEENLPPSSDAPSGPSSGSGSGSGAARSDPFATSSSPVRLAARLEASVVLNSTVAGACEARRTTLQPLSTPANLSPAEREMTVDDWLIAQVDKAYKELESAGNRQIEELERSIKVARAQIEATLRGAAA